MDREITVLPSSPEMLAGEVVNVHQHRKRSDNIMLPFAQLSVGMSLSVPFEIAHEPSLRVRVSRENAKGGRQYRLIKHGPPIFVYEIGCLPDTGEPAPIVFPKPED